MAIRRWHYPCIDPRSYRNTLNCEPDLKQASQIHAFTDLKRFSVLRADIQQKSDAVVKEVAKEFEALFIEMMLSSARKATPEGGLFNSHALQLYREMFDTQAARVLAEQGALGFEDSIGRFLDGASGATGADARPDDDSAIPARQLQLPARQASFPPLPVLAPVQQEAVDSAWNRAVLFSNPVRPKGVPNVEHMAANQQAFVERVWPHAEKAAEHLGTSPSVLVAQAALETGWGKHIIAGDKGKSSNNLFGIKADQSWQGRSADARTFEFMGGRPIKINAKFRAYRSVAEAFTDYVSFVKENPRYARALGHANNPDSYIRELARAGYATDPRYADKIISIKARIDSGSDKVASGEFNPPLNSPPQEHAGT